MNLLLYGLLPLLIYVLVDFYAQNMRRAITVAIVFGVFELVYIYTKTGRLDQPSLIACLLLIFCGLLSIQRQNRLYFKLQPAIVAFITAGFVAYLQFASEPLLDRYAPLIEQAAPEGFREHLKSGPIRARFDGLMNILPFVLAFHGVWILYTASRSRQSIWLAVNAFGFPLLLLPVALVYLLIF